MGRGSARASPSNRRCFAFAWLLLAGIALPARGDTPLQEYVDPRYHFAFQYPSDWTVDRQIKPGAGGETRVVVRDPRGSARASASIGRLERTITRANLHDSPQVAESLLAVALKQIYERTSQQLHGKKMLVASKQARPSEGGIQLHISTLHTIGNDQFVIAGMHFIPFDQPQMISLIIMSPFHLDAAQQKTNNAVLTSFRWVGDQR